MKATELKKGNSYLLTDKYFTRKQDSIQVTFIECLSDGTRRFSFIKDGHEYTFGCGRDYVEKYIIEIPSTTTIYCRRDQQGRNTAFSLEYWKGFSDMLHKGYNNLNIHERISVRASFCGKEYPSVMIMEQLKFEQTL